MPRSLRRREVVGDGDGVGVIERADDVVPLHDNGTDSGMSGGKDGLMLKVAFCHDLYGVVGVSGRQEFVDEDYECGYDLERLIDRFGEAGFKDNGL